MTQDRKPSQPPWWAWLAAWLLLLGTLYSFFDDQKPKHSPQHIIKVPPGRLI